MFLTDYSKEKLAKIDTPEAMKAKGLEYAGNNRDDARSYEIGIYSHNLNVAKQVATEAIAEVERLKAQLKESESLAESFASKDDEEKLDKYWEIYYGD